MHERVCVCVCVRVRASPAPVETPSMASQPLLIEKPKQDEAPPVGHGKSNVPKLHLLVLKFETVVEFNHVFFVVVDCESAGNLQYSSIIRAGG
jgi:hypothetical protein